MASDIRRTLPELRLPLVPDATLGVGRLHAEASDHESSAFAFVGNQVDTIGVLPSFRIGSVRTTARTTQVNESTLEVVATSEVSDLDLLGGLLSIGHLTSEASTEIVDDTPSVTASKVTVSGATIAGVPVGITEAGIVGLGSATALAPIVDSLVAPLVEQGITVRTTPSRRTVGDRTAVAEAGALLISVPLDVQGYPGILDITFGRTLAELEVGALTAGGAGSFELGSGPTGVGSTPLPGLGTSTSDLDFGLTPTGGSAAPSAGGTVTEVVSVPVGRIVEDWDLTAAYRVLLLGGIALFVGGRMVMRSTTRPTRRPNDLRPLWRW